MPKIFNISSNPVSTIESALKGMNSVEYPVRKIEKNVLSTEPKKVSIVAKKEAVSNPIVKMRNGFGKLMSHFSKPKVK